MSGGQLGEQERRQRAGVTERLVVVVHESLDQVGGVRLDDELGVLGVMAPRHGAGVGPLVEAVAVVEADRERRHALAGLGHKPDDGRRVDAAAEKGAEGDIRHQASLDCRAQQTPNLTCCAVERHVEPPCLRDAGQGQTPVALDPRRRAVLCDEHVARRDAADALVERVRASARSRRSGSRGSPLRAAAAGPTDGRATS